MAAEIRYSTFLRIRYMPLTTLSPQNNAHRKHPIPHHVSEEEYNMHAATVDNIDRPYHNKGECHVSCNISVIFFRAISS